MQYVNSLKNLQTP